MHKNIMVMAGTRDAANIIKKLKSMGKFNIIATTTTQYGAQIVLSAGADEALSDKMDENELVDLIKKKEIETLIDATHPFAVLATKNAIRSTEICGINYIRFERPREDIINNSLIHRVSSFKEAALKADSLKNGNVLHLAGVETLSYIINKIDKDRIFARVLPSVYSIQKCLNMGLKQENIIAMQGIFSERFNKALMEEYDISLIITKESGKTGGTLSKINAALDLEIPVVMVTPPEILELKDKTIFYNIDDLCNFL